MAAEKPRVLFLCAHNAARSQMAEALLRRMAGDRFEVCSAGLDPTEVHPLALAVLDEAGVETGRLHAKGVREFLGGRGVRYAILLCQEETDACPRIFPFAARTLVWPLPDPSMGDGPALERFRETRDAITRRLEAWLATLGSESAPGLRHAG
jgi:arsenate reductase